MHDRMRKAGARVRIASQILALLSLMAGLTACQEPTPMLVGGLAPELSVLDLKDQPVKLTDYRNEVVVLQFWTGGCGPCLAEMPVLAAFYQQYKDLGVTVLSVNLGEEAASIQAVVERLKLPFPVLSDRLQISAERYQVDAVPILFVLDRDGILREKIMGELGDVAQLGAKVTPWLKAEQPLG